MAKNAKRIHFLLSLYWLTTLSGVTLAQQKTVGIFDGQADVGSVQRPGSVNYKTTVQTYEVSGSGINIWGSQDEFHFLYKRMKGDFIVYARGQWTSKGTDPNRKMGWMARTSLDANAPHISAVVHGNGITSLQLRRTAGGETQDNPTAVKSADVIQLERRGKTFTVRVARFGEPFQTREVADVELGNDVYVGLFVCAHNKDVTEKALYRDVRLSAPVSPDEKPGVMKLASRLELLEVATGNRTVIHTDPHSIQAPNWTKDGKTLIYNGNGLINAFDLASRQEKVLNTGEVKNNNNDHVLSFDSKMLGLSSGVNALGGSIIYTVSDSGWFT